MRIMDRNAIEMRTGALLNGEAFSPHQPVGQPQRVNRGIALQVLVVGNDDYTVDGLTELVRSWGHQCQSLNAHASLEHLDLLQPDVLILNSQEPVVSSCEVAHRLISQLASPDCLVIAIADHKDSCDRRRIRRAGIDLTLVRPFEASVLETLLLLECTHINFRSLEARLEYALHVSH